MKKAFTLIELLVVIAIISILAALLIPVLNKAKKEALKSDCRGNEHHLGQALKMTIAAHDDLYDIGRQTGYARLPACQLLGLMMLDDYINDFEILVCPEFSWRTPREPHLSHDMYRTSRGCIYPKDASTDSSNWRNFNPQEICYFLDEGRIHPNPDPARVVLADGIEMCTINGMEPANHPDGVNQLYVDLSVSWQRRMSASSPVIGSFDYGEAGNDCSPPVGTIFVRWGYIPNGRLQEDENEDDRDDIYFIEGTDPVETAIPENVAENEWFMIGAGSRFQVDTDEGYTWADTEQAGTSKNDTYLGGGAIGDHGSNKWRGGGGAGWYGRSSNSDYCGWQWGIPEEYALDFYDADHDDPKTPALLDQR